MDIQDQNAQIADQRVPLTAAARDALRDFSKAAGMNYTQAVMWLLHQIQYPNENARRAGLRVGIAIRQNALSEYEQPVGEGLDVLAQALDPVRQSDDNGDA